MTMRSEDARQARPANAGKEIGRLFWMLWVLGLAAFNAWMAFVVHPNTNAYNGYDVLAWVCGNCALVILMIINACVLVTARDRRRRRSNGVAVGAETPPAATAPANGGPS